MKLEDQPMTAPAMRNIIAIGGSAGSSTPLRQLLSDLPADLPASIFVSTHIPAHGPSFLVDVLSGSATMPVTCAVDDQPIEPNRVYVAAPDRHLLLIDNTIRLGTGPQENMVRPAIDPLFRSAACSFGPRVIGVVLSGMLNDGAAGLHAIKACGGTAVVQHPIDADADQMPLAALEATEVDHVAPASGLGALLATLAQTEVADATFSPPPDLWLEVEIAAGARLGSDRLRRIAEPSVLTCPDCHGVLSEVKNSRPLRFRCQIGHGYTAASLAAEIGAIDEAVRVAMRMMEERVSLVDHMAADARATGRSAVAELYEARAEEYRRYAKTLRDAAVTSLRLSQAPGSEAFDDRES
ncbi:chemotaxis protein CheB [Rhizosaccharibacter radicis]|uniref:protein-glutamate methylesterase n=1 Tax=Rhizosaccharibacter radicis TaxID=2782605 RepID=A0ABT1VW18_9PROT|nr:chemotaxis protein CheB [Acetobacteraceae bacterium KSS12]